MSERPLQDGVVLPCYHLLVNHNEGHDDDDDDKEEEEEEEDDEAGTLM